MLTQLPSPAIFAHRGSSLQAPENTLSAFLLAVQQKADGIELDVKLTKDERVVVIHDQTVDRTTNGHGRVSDLTLSEIHNLDAGSYFDKAYSNERVPLLESVLDTIGDQLLINIELTNYATPFDRLPQKVAEIVKVRNLHNILFSSFHPVPLIRIHRLLPDFWLGLLALPGKPGAIARSCIGKIIPYQSLNPEKKDITPGFVHKIHAWKKKVFVYTVNEMEELKELFKVGVDGVFTDDPVLAKKVLAQIKPVLQEKS